MPPWTALTALGFVALPARASWQELTAQHADSARPGAVRTARISPDGAWVVFSAGDVASGSPELHRVPLDGGSSPVRIGGSLVDSRGERWSLGPDGRRVFYVGQDLAGVALDGSSAPVRLSDPGAPPLDFVSSPDGARVVYRGAPVGASAGLFSVAADGSTRPIELVPPGGAGEVGHYRVEPRGCSVVFTSRHEDGAFAKLYRTPIDGGSAIVLDSPRFGIRDFLISPDGGRVVYRCFREGRETCELDVVPVDGSQPPTRLALAREGSDIQGFEIGLDGSWVVYLADQGNGRSELCSVPADGSAAPLVLGRDLATSFLIHPGGDRVLYRADHEQDERFALFLAPIDGRSAPLELNAPLGPAERVGWFGVTPDGARIVYQVRRGGEPASTTTALWQVSLADGGARTALGETAAAADGFQISPDGSHVFYRDQSALRGVALDGTAASFTLEANLVSDEFRISADGGRVLYQAQRESARVLASVRADGSAAPVRLHATRELRALPSGGLGGQIASTAGGSGYRDFSFGTTGSPTPTSEKPENKLWWNDGAWWGSLYDAAAQDYHVYALNPGTQRWVDTGTVLDDRTGSKADVLWEQANQKLYVASHIFSSDGRATPSSWGRLLRYSYSSASKTYTLDAGFPVDITRGSAEALTIARDTQGRLWATWVEAARVMVNRSLGSDAQWGTPFVLPASPASVAVTTDDLSAIVAFGGRIGVMWSNQLTATTYFAVHQDGDGDAQWQPEEVVVPGASCSGACADDHLNLKADAGGRVFVVLKTSLTGPDEPLNIVAVRGASGGWTGSTFGVVRDDHTRPILLLDERNARVHVFATSHEGGGAIFHKSAPLSNLSFEPGLGAPFIQNAADVEVNNATSTRQNLDERTDLVVLASDEVTRFYLHNFLDLGGAGNAPTLGSFSPTSGPAGTNVSVSGTNLDGTTSVRFNGAAADFSVSSSTHLRATVPAGATTGGISVTTPHGSASSSGPFTVTQPPSIASFSPSSGPVGTSVTVRGASLGGTSSLEFKGTPAAFDVVSSTEIRTQVPGGAATGKISVTTPHGSASSASDFRVTNPPPSIHSFLPPFGFVLVPVTVLGSNFTGATGVKFDGRAAGFTVVGDDVILTAVPLGATTGKITVTSPAGTGVSPTDFVVIGL